MRVLWSSNGPHTTTGYGTQTKHILRGIRDLGYPVACIAWWGIIGGPVEWEGITLYPSQMDAYGNDATAHYIRRFRADLLVTLIDLWVLNPAIASHGARWAPYFPIDHADPVPSAIAERFAAAKRLIVYSKWAERQVKEYDSGKYQWKVRYIPHGIDTTALTPATDEERKAQRRRLFPDWPADAFICGMVSANKGYPSRKSFFEVFEAFARFVKDHPNARLYLHSFIGREFNGPPLQDAAKAFGIADYVRFPNQQMMLAGDFDDALMRDLYRSFDVLLCPSQGEGFGLPIVEAQACGTPVIVTDHSAMSELVGAGWRVKPRHMIMSLLWSQFAEADPDGIHHALEECIRTPNPRYLREAARDFALRYAWPNVISESWAPFLAEMDGGRRDISRELWMPRAKIAPAPALAPSAGNGARPQLQLV